VDDGTIPTCKASSAQEHQVDLHIADQTLGGVYQLVQSLQSHLLLRCTWRGVQQTSHLTRVESRGMTPIIFNISPALDMGPAGLPWTNCCIDAPQTAHSWGEEDEAWRASEQALIPLGMACRGFSFRRKWNQTKFSIMKKFNRVFANRFVSLFFLFHKTLFQPNY
jgi:hypothetical protein